MQKSVMGSYLYSEEVKPTTFVVKITCTNANIKDTNRVNDTDAVA